MADDLEPCPGRYCGRNIQVAEGLNASCGSCPRGFRTNGTVCVKCTDPLSAYDTLFLAFMVLLVVLPAAAAIYRKVGMTRKEYIMMGVCLAVETTVSLCAALLLTCPLGSSSLRSCGMSNIRDWYPSLHNPTLDDHVSTLHCTSEVVFPLLTWVLIFDVFSLLTLVLCRLPVSMGLCRNGGGGFLFVYDDDY